MNHWTFVIAAYAFAIAATAALLILSYRAMRSAEDEAERFRDRR